MTAECLGRGAEAIAEHRRFRAAERGGEVIAVAEDDVAALDYGAR